MAERLNRKWCRVCVREVTGQRRICERCRTREKRGQQPVEPVARLVTCQHCHSSFGVPFGVDVPPTCSARCERRMLDYAAREAERLAGAEAWAEREAERAALAALPDPEPVYEERWVMEQMPGAPWSSRSVRRMVQVN